MHEDGIVCSVCHNLGIHLVRRKLFNALFPQAGGLTHGNPNIGINNMSTLSAFIDIACYRNGAIVLCRNSTALLNQFAIRRISFRTTGNVIHAQLSAANHQRIGNVVFRIAHKHYGKATNIAEILPDGQRVSNKLGRMSLGSQAIPNRNTRIFS